MLVVLDNQRATMLLVVLGIFAVAFVTAIPAQDDCPPPFSAVNDIFCPEDYNPVMCDSGRCEYSNDCVGFSAGFESNCCVKCPNPEWGPGETVCDADVDDTPVYCQRECEAGVEVECEYSNQCFADAAGLDVSSCSTTSSKQGSTGEEDEGEGDVGCPKEGSADPDMMCTADMAPVMCNGGACEYSNDCVALTAGFPMDTCCLKCPNPSFNADDPMCDTPVDPVQCERECEPGLTVQCGYDSMCLAEAAGLDPADCTTKSDKEGTGTDGECPEVFSAAPDMMCTEDSIPVVCNDGACEYTNECHAESAGIFGDACCVKCPSPTFDADEETCDPSVDEPISCERECRPGVMVVCEYANLCMAKAAGLETKGKCFVVDPAPVTPSESPVKPPINPTDSSSSCPEVSTDGPMCAANLQPVLCDAGNCEYANGCVAAAAGFTVDDCCLKCPEPVLFEDEEDPTCDPSAEEPITCEHECQPGVMVECEYANMCMAKAAGIDTEGNCFVVDFAPPSDAPITKPATTATSSDDTCPEALSINPDTLCADFFDPVLCDGGQCEYANECVASTAGFDEGDCCAKCPNPFWESDETPCEMSDEWVVCERECEPGITVECTYMNLCHAQAAGLDEDQCTETDDAGELGATGDSPPSNGNTPSKSPTADEAPTSGTSPSWVGTFATALTSLMIVVVLSLHD